MTRLRQTVANRLKSAQETAALLTTFNDVDMSAVIDESKSLNEGAILPKDFAVGSWWWEIYANSGMFDLDKPIKKYSKEERANLLDLDDGRKIKVGKIGLTYEGVVVKLKKGMGSKDPEQLQPHVRREYDRIFTRKLCPACNGARLNKGMPSFNGVIPPEDVEKIRQYILKRGHDLKAQLDGAKAATPAAGP